jgi:hypothetical protein
VLHWMQDRRIKGIIVGSFLCVYGTVNISATPGSTSERG